MPQSGFSLTDFFKESKSTLTKPGEYFSLMKKEGGYVEPALKALIYGLTAGIITFILSLFDLIMIPMATAGQKAVSIFTPAIIVPIIVLFVGSVLMLVISAICGGSTKYEANVRVTASLLALLPVYSLIFIFPGISFKLSFAAALIILLYEIWLMYNALIGALQAKKAASKVFCTIFAALVSVVMLGGFTCGKIVSNRLKQIKDSGILSDQYIPENEFIKRELPPDAPPSEIMKKALESMKKMQEENN